MWHWGYGPWWTGLLFLLFWVVVIALIVWAVRSTGRTSQGASRRRALDVLEERYARGEIDDDEFRHRKEMLERPDS